ncbi:hypothetical protein FGRMN_4152 [Fusarium graminum]|nr:hypothetical protein FGRMN_4152 [Fusarium graminum]
MDPRPEPKYESLGEKLQRLIRDAPIGKAPDELFVEEIWKQVESSYQIMCFVIESYCKANVKVQAKVESRVKSRSSIEKSIVRRQKHRKDNGKEPYSDLKAILDDLHDLVGVRIVVDFTVDVETANNWVKETFAQEKEPNVFDADRQVGYYWKPWFGAYQSWNYPVSANAMITKDSGDLKPYYNVMFEIQVTCLAESLYNRLAHRLLYKGKLGSIPKKDEMVIDIAHGLSLCHSICLLYFKDEMTDPELLEGIKEAAPSVEVNDEAGDPTRLIERLRKLPSTNPNLNFSPKIPLSHLSGEASSRQISVRELLASLEPPGDGSSLISREIVQAHVSTLLQEVAQNSSAPIPSLPEVSAARFDSKELQESPMCHVETRKTILAKVESWINKSDNPETMLWIYGPAGTGKSTLARTLADRCNKKDTLAAGYFFRRGGGGEHRNETARLFPTLANQLTKYFPGFGALLRESLQRSACSEDQAEDRGLQEQFEILIQNPLAEIKTMKGTLKVIIIDALDECTEPANFHTIVKLLSSLRGPSYMRLCVLLTSRETRAIRLSFEEFKKAGHGYGSIPLHKESVSETAGDISKYLTAGFVKIKERKNIKGDWPSSEDVKLVIRRATIPQPLFIYASTLLRFIHDENGNRNSFRRFQTWIKQCRENISQLGAMYQPILEDAFAGDDDEDDIDGLKDFKRFLTAIFCAKRALSANELCSLLNLNMNDIHHWLEGLRPVLHVPDSDKEPTWILHESFRDYIFRQEDSRKEHLRLEYTESIRILAECSLQWLARTKKSCLPLSILESNQKTHGLHMEKHANSIKDIKNLVRKGFGDAYNYHSRNWWNYNILPNIELG